MKFGEKNVSLMNVIIEEGWEQYRQRQGGLSKNILTQTVLLSMAIYNLEQWQCILGHLVKYDIVICEPEMGVEIERNYLARFKRLNATNFADPFASIIRPI